MKNKEENIIHSGYKECPICRGTGIEIIKQKFSDVYGEEKVDAGAPCSKCNGAIYQRSEEMRKHANIPVSFYNADITKFKRDIYKNADGSVIDISKQMKVVDSFINNFQTWEGSGMGLYIYSSMKGSGKTYLASCICNTLISKYSMGTKFVSASNLLELSKQSTEHERYVSEYDKDPIKLLCNCKLLVIDDLGQKTIGVGWLEDLLFRITDARMQQKLVTIYTSNIKMECLGFDDRIVDRIYGTCMEISLPEFCVRSKKAYEVKKQFLAELGLVEKG